MSYLLIRGNSLQLPIADGVVQACATSPPYWGLRDYGLPATAWPAVAYAPMPGLPPVEVPEMDCCLGLEPTPEAFVGHLVLVFREVRRVLRSDGVCWLNLGDSYQSGKGAAHGTDPRSSPRRFGRRSNDGKQNHLRHKDLVGIPWRSAFALQADGWWLRSAPPWLKENPMPESVDDRPGTAHEYVFLLTRSAGYFYDSEAIKKPSVSSDRIGPDGFYVGNRRTPNEVDAARLTQRDNRASMNFADPSGRNRRTADWSFEALEVAAAYHRDQSAYLSDILKSGGMLADDGGDPSAFLVNTRPYSGAHFACWPPDLVEPMILAGTSERGCCPACRAPWVRVVERDRKATRPGVASKVYATAPLDPDSPYRTHNGDICGNRDPERHVTETRTVGWESSCPCDAGDPIPCIVLDVFNGSGTTGEVARLHGRSYIGVDLNPQYLHEIASDRVERGERPHKPRAKTRDDGPLPLFA